MVNFYSIKYSGDQLSSLLDKIYNLSYSASDGILLAQVAETPEITTKQYTDGLYYWYINGEKTNVINSVGEGAELPNATAGEDGFWYLNGSQTNISIKKSTTISIDPQYNKFLNYLTKDEIETKLTDINQLIESIKESKQDLLISGDGINIDPETNTISVVGIPTKVSDLENDSDYATMNEVKEYTDSAFATKENYTELSSANLSDLLSVGKYKIENAEDTPTSEKSGYLAVMNLNETTRQEWTTDSDFSYRDGEFSTVSSIGENNFYVNGVLQQEIPEDKIVKLYAGSKYTLSGYLNGSIEIVYPEGISSDSELTDDTELHLDNITFNSTTATKIINYPFTEKKLIIFLDKNSYNYIINKGTASTSRNEDAVIYSENDLYIEGVGGLSIESNLGNHGLKANDIVIQGNTKLKFNVAHDAIHGSQLVEIDYGEIHIDGAYDGIECKNESTNNAYVRILGGNIFISNCTHGAIGAKTSGFVCNSLTHITFDSNTKNVLDQTDGLGQIIFLEDVEITGDSSISEYSFSDYFGEGGVYRATENSETGEYEFNPETDGIELVGDTYTINDEKAVILLQGFINNKRIVINGKSSDIILNKAYISYSGDAPTIYYTVDSKKLAIKTINDSLNYVIQNSTEKPSGDCDAIKSENNLQFSSNGYLIASSTFGDAADGSDFTLKSDGAKYFLNSGERGIKGTTLFIGADSDDVSEGTADNSYLSVYALGNNTGTDFADIYARNGKLTKGTYTLYNYMKGFVLCDSFKSVEGPDTILRKSVYAKTTDLISSGIEVYEDINYDKLSLRQLFKFAEWTIYSNDKIITKKLEDYALKSEIPTSNSQLANDSNFITNAVADLVNYYKKSETYTKDEIDQRLSSIPKFNIEAVDSLPTENISNTTIYLLKTGDESQNLYTEFIYIDGVWEKLGTQTLDLSGLDLSGYATQEWVIENYATKAELPTKVSQLENDSNFQNEEQVKQLIEDSSASIGGVFTNPIIKGNINFENGTINYNSISTYCDTASSFDFTNANSFLVPNINDSSNSNSNSAVSKKYVDDKITGVNSKITSSVSEVKSYTDTKVSEAKSYTDDLINRLIDGAPDTFDTLKEIADYIESDKSGASSMLSAIQENTQNILLKANANDVYTKLELDNKLSEKVNQDELNETLTNYATKVEIPTNISDLTNDSGFITNLVNDLANYYKKSETYTKNEIDQRISSIPKFNISVVNSLPLNDISNTTIYLLKTGDESQNLYTEYIYINDTWERLGTQTLDLSGYATQEWVISKNYLTKENLSGYATEDWVSSKNYITSESLNGYATEDWVNNKNYAVKTEIPTNVSQLVNDSNYQNDEQVKQLIDEKEALYKNKITYLDALPETVDESTPDLFIVGTDMYYLTDNQSSPIVVTPSQFKIEDIRAENSYSGSQELVASGSNSNNYTWYLEDTNGTNLGQSHGDITLTANPEDSSKATLSWSSTGKVQMYFSGNAVAESDGNKCEVPTTIAYEVLCLTGDTLITMYNGTKKRIDQIKVGEKVLSFNTKTGLLGPDEVCYSDWDKGKYNDHYDLYEFDDGTKIKVVHRHRFYNVEDQRMIHLDSWKLGDRAFKQDGSTPKLISATPHYEDTDTLHYSIFTKNNNYFANGLLCGNIFTEQLKKGK